ncbi:MAG: LysM peptidoglycan-binding domain-containing protein [Chloroflexi bacterium]|nr:LysM peptidoglycan-binding domain-containing protein [Chloroflexota bacterium]
MSHSRLLRAFVLFINILLIALPLTAFADNITHTVQPGENLFRIALRYGVSVDVLAAANGISDVRLIYVGQVLIIPDPANVPVQDLTQPEVNNALVAADTAYHTVQRGETLASIARLYGMTWQELATLNGIDNPNRIYAGQQLLIVQPAGTQTTTDAAAAPAPVDNSTPAPASEAVTTTHVVQPGEYLAQIARIYGVDWMSIARANNITNPNTVYAGQALIIPAPGSFTDLGIIEQGAPPAVTMGRSIVVDLSDQRIYAYEDGVLVRNVLVSTGLPATPTVQGDFTIYVRHVAQTMSGPGYYLPDVPYVMYFYQGYGIHGTYWHNNFGNPMSHGCVNLPTPEAEWFFNWASVGTPVHVQA